MNRRASVGSMPSKPITKTRCAARLAGFCVAAFREHPAPITARDATKTTAIDRRAPAGIIRGSSKGEAAILADGVQ
jgi:hypothetical protein